MSSYSDRNPGEGLPELSQTLGSGEAAERLYELDHKNNLSNSEARELKRLEKRAGR